MLIRVRNEYRMIHAHYQTLYGSSIAFGMRKTLQANRDKENKVTRINALERECEGYEEEADKLEVEYEKIVREQAVIAARKEEEHLQSVTDLKADIFDCKNKLKDLLPQMLSNGR